MCVRVVVMGVCDSGVCVRVVVMGCMCEGGGHVVYV